MDNEMKRYDIDFRGEFLTLDELNSIRLRYARIANERLRVLEKAGRAYWAYDVAVSYTRRSRGRNRFNQKKTWEGTKEGLLHEVEELQAFLNMKTSTLRGSKAVEQRIVNTFQRDHGIDIDSIGRTDFFNFLTFLNTKSSEYNMIPSEMAIDFYTRSRGGGAKHEDIVSVLEEYKKGKIKNLKDLYGEFNLSVIE